MGGIDPQAGWDGDQEEEDEEEVVVVGYAFMTKKMDAMTKVMAVGPGEGLEFIKLDFSCPPEKHRRLDVVLHKLSDDIMFRNVRSEGNARLTWIEEYLAGHPETVLLDPFDKVASVINRVTTLEILTKAYRNHGTAMGMPRPPRFVVLERNEVLLQGKNGFVSRSGLAFPVICKPIEACGTRGSHTMVVVLDQAGMRALTTPIVVQEYSNHGARLYKVCVVGDDVRVHERPSLPDLPPGLVGSFSFDSQKAYPTLAEVQAISAATTVARGLSPPPLSSPARMPLIPRITGDVGNPSARSSDPRLEYFDDRGSTVSVPSTTKAGTETVLLPEPAVTRESARVAAAYMRETFGLSIFGFDLIVDEASGEPMVIDVNYFPSFKDLADFPQVLRQRLKQVVARAEDTESTEGIR